MTYVLRLKFRSRPGLFISVFNLKEEVVLEDSCEYLFNKIQLVTASPQLSVYSSSQPLPYLAPPTAPGMSLKSSEGA